MIIASIFARDGEAAMIVFSIKDKVAQVIQLQEFLPGRSDIGAAAVEVKQAEKFIVSPDPGVRSSEGCSLELMLKTQLKCQIVTADRFQPMAAIATLEALKRSAKFLAEGFPQGPLLQKEIEQINRGQSVRLMAFLQGILAAAKEVNREPMYFSMRLANGQKSRSHADQWQRWEPAAAPRYDPNRH